MKDSLPAKNWIRLSEGGNSLPDCIPDSPEDPVHSEPCTQRRPGSRSKVLHTQLGNRAFVETFGTQDSVQKQEMPSPCLSHGWGRRPWRILINLLTPEKQTASHARHSASYLCCSLLGNKEDRVNGNHFFLIQVRNNITVKFQRRGKYSISRAICWICFWLYAVFEPGLLGRRSNGPLVHYFTVSVECYNIILNDMRIYIKFIFTVALGAQHTAA